MISPACERALNDARERGTALLKFISANDVGTTGGHQYGFYLPKQILNIFTPYPPEKGVNRDHFVLVTWPDGKDTTSVVKWYGQGTRSEYRLTRFGRDFRWRTPDNLGNLLVLVPLNIQEFHAYVLDLDEDIQEIQAGLGIEVIDSWAFYRKDQALVETEDACLNRQFRRFAGAVEAFPGVRVFSDCTRKAVLECVPGFGAFSPDEQILRLIKEEYALFRMVERKIFGPEVQRLFASIDDFLNTAQQILQARKSRAGRSFENHVEDLLRGAKIPFEMRIVVDDTRPDIIIPGKKEYEDSRYPADRLFMVGVKTTCKDRWRQVIREAPRIRHKHIFTLQKGISKPQLDEIFSSDISLIVPGPLHKEYPPVSRKNLLDARQFLQIVRETLE